MNRRVQVEDALLPEDLRYSLTDLTGGVREWKGLSLLVESLLNSRTCEVDPNRGEIIAEFDTDTVVALSFVAMLRSRLDWFGRHENLVDWWLRPDGGRPLLRRIPNTHLDVWARRKEDPRWQLSVCVMATGSKGLPITDLATSFVMWAENGFHRSPQTLVDAITYLKGDIVFEQFQIRREAEERAERERIRLGRLTRARDALISERAEMIRRAIEDMESQASNMGWRELMTRHRTLIQRAAETPLDEVEECISGVFAEILSNYTIPDSHAE